MKIRRLLCTSLFLISLAWRAAAQPVWTQLAPTNSLPAVRQGHTTVFDPTNNRLILFGGSTGNINSVPTQLNDVWVLANADGTGGTPSWTQLAPTGGPPQIRSYHTAVYDSANNRMIIFGGNPTVGFCNGALQDVWVLSNANGLGGTPTWTQLAPTGGPPSPRNLHAATYDAVDNRLIISGGQNPCQSNADDVWLLSNANGLGGTPAWTQLSITGTTPLGRNGHSIHYDSANNRLILFAGYTSTAQTNDVWTLSNANGLAGSSTWTRLSPTGSVPLPRSYFGAHYDALNNNLILFGGSSSAGTTNDVWILSNANGSGTPAWTRISPTGTLPPSRDTLASSYNVSNGRLMVFGGRNCTGTCVALNDSWVLPLNTNTNPPPAITSFNPSAGIIGASVAISGSNFVGVTAVNFNGTSATFTNNSSTLITTAVPSGATTGPIAVFTTNGTATTTSNFVVNLPPTISSFTPTIGSTGSVVTISGANLASVTNVQFNGTSAVFSNATFSQLTAVVPNGAVTGPISVASPYGTATSANNFTVRTNALMIVGPLYPPPGGLSFTQSGSAGDGSIGRAGGKTWMYQGVQIANSAATYWGTTNGGVRLSFLGPVYPNPSVPSEILTNAPNLSALSNGVVVWTGQTFLPGNGTPVYTKFTMTVKDLSNNPLPLLDPLNLGLSANLGGLLQVTSGLSYQANLKFEASYSPSSGFQPALDFYDAQTTAAGSAFSSFSGAFYYENTVPIISGLSNQIVNWNTQAGPYSFTLNDTETGQNSLNVWATSTNQSLLFDANIFVDRFGGNSAQVRLYPNSGQAGTTLVTIFASDGYATNSSSFLLTVNSPPTISDITDKKTNKNTPAAINFTINDLETNPDSLVLSATSTNTSLVPTNNIIFSGSGTNRTVTITPLSNQIGTTLITITVSDGMATASDSFELLVNDPPQLTFNLPLNLSQTGSATINNSLLEAVDTESSAAQIVYTVGFGGAGGPPHEGFLRLNGTNLASGDIFTQDDLNNNRLSYLNGGGCATTDDFQFNVSDSDGGVTPTGAFTVFSFHINVSHTNRAPVAVNGNANVGLGATIQNTFGATDTDCPPVTLTFRILTNGVKGTATLINTNTGAFTYTASAGQSGTDTIVFQVNDGALGSASPGTFNLTIANQPPSVTNGFATTFENVPLSGTLSASDPDLPPQLFTFSIITNGSKGNAVVTNSASGEFVYTPTSGAIGVDTFAFSVSDGFLTSTGIFTVTIRANLDAGDVIVADQQKRIVLIDPANGAQAIISSNGIFGSPRSVAVEPSGNLIVVDNSVGLIRVNPKTGAQTLLATNFSTAGLGAGGVAVEADGNILVADGGNGIVRVNPATGAKTTVSSGGNLFVPFGITLGCNGDIYVSDVSAFAGQPSRVLRIDPTTGAQTLVSTGLNLIVPISLTLDGDDNIFVSDPATFAGGSYDLVTRIDPITGAQTVVATNTLLHLPTGIAFSTAQKLFTINQANGTLVQVDPVNGVETLISSNGYLAQPFGLTVVRATPAFTASNLQGNNGVQFSISGETGRCIIVESSTNLLDWSVYKNLSNPTGQTSFSETNTFDVPARYFRARTR